MTTPLPLVDVAPVLRQARERRGVSLEDAARATRISADYLQALEADAPLTAFPSPTYARFFLRSFAKFLELDEEPLIQAFATRHGGERPLPSPPLAGAAKAPPPSVAVSDEPTGVQPDIFTSGRKAPVPFTPAAIQAQARARRRKGGGVISPIPIEVTGSNAFTSPRRRRTHRRGAIAVAASVALAALVVAVAVPLARSTRRPAALPSHTPPPSPLVLLPRGGRTIFPSYRVVALRGAPGTRALGILGLGSPDEAASRLRARAEGYGAGPRPVLPALELVATTVLSTPGPDGLYRSRQRTTVLQAYLEAARAAKMLLVLDVQPGRADFLKEVKVYASFLRQPDVGLALDPEWAVGAGEVPGKVFGSVDATTVNHVSGYLANLVARGHLPQKLLVIHQFTTGMLKDKQRIVARDGIATVVAVDGSGKAAEKAAKYQLFARGFHSPVFHGITLYEASDPDLMDPGAILNLAPRPDYIVYQ